MNLSRKSFITRLIALVMVIANLTSIGAMATDVSVNGGTGSVPAILTAEAAVFNVSVPSGLPVNMDEHGVITVANNAKVVNHGHGAVRVTDVFLMGVNGWESVDYDSCNMKTEKVGTKKFAAMINGQKTIGANMMDLFEQSNFPGMTGAVDPGDSDEMPIIYDVKLPAQTTTISGLAIAYVVFTVGWDTVDPSYPSVMDLALYDGAYVLMNGQSADLNDLTTYALETPIWTSSDNSIVSVTDKGIMTAHALGTVTITCEIGSDSESIMVRVADAFTVEYDNLADVGYTGAANENLVIPEWIEKDENLYRVTELGSWSLYQCANLRSLTLPDSLTVVGEGAINECTGLTTITIPDGVMVIGDQVFYGCSALTTINLGSSVSSIGWDALNICESLTNINVDPNNDTYCSVDGVLFSKDMKTLIRYPQARASTSYIIPDSVTSIADSAFQNCTALKSVTFGNHLEEIGHSAFFCAGLETVTIPDSVTYISGWAFRNCKSLETAVVGNGVTLIDGNVFSGCTALTTVTLPASITHIYQYAFNYCSALTLVQFGGTEDQWNAIIIEEDNDILATVPKAFAADA